MKTKHQFSKLLTGLISLATLSSVVSTSLAHAECVAFPAGSIKSVATASSGWIMIQLPNGNFNAAGLLSIDAATKDSTKQQMLSTATAAFLSGSAVFVCRSNGAVDQWGYTQRLDEIRLYK